MKQTPIDFLLLSHGALFLAGANLPVGWSGPGAYTGSHEGWNITIYERSYAPTEAFMLMDLTLARADNGLQDGWLSQAPIVTPQNQVIANYRYLTYRQQAAIKIPMWSTQLITGVARGKFAGGRDVAECPDDDLHIPEFVLQKNEYICTSPFSINEAFCIATMVKSIFAPILDEDSRTRLQAITNGTSYMPVGIEEVNSRLQGTMYTMVLEQITKTVSKQIDTCITEGDVYSLNVNNTLFDGLKKRLWHRAQSVPQNHTIGVGITGTLNSDYGIAFNVGAGIFFVEFDTDNSTTLINLATKIANIRFGDSSYPFMTSLVWNDANTAVVEVLIESSNSSSQVMLDSLRIAATPNTNPTSLPGAEIRTRTAAPFVEADVPVILEYYPNETKYTALKNLRAQLEDLFVNDPYFKGLDRSTLQLHISQKYAYLLQNAPVPGPIAGQYIESLRPASLAELAITLGIGEVAVKPNMEGNVWILTPKGNIYFAVNSSTDFNTFETKVGGFGARDKSGKSLEGWLVIRWLAMAGTTFEYYRKVATNLGGCYDGSVWGSPDPNCIGGPFKPGCDLSVFANY